MVILLSEEISPGSNRWKKILKFKSRKDGSGPLAKRWNGSVESGIVRRAAKYFSVETAAVEMFLNGPGFSGKSFRVTKIS